MGRQQQDKRKISQECQICNKKYGSRYDLQKHVKYAHKSNQEKGKCGQCERNFPNEHQLNRHIQGKHKAKEFKCEYCLIELSTAGKLKVHIDRAHLKLKNVSCDKCNYKGYSVVDLRTHNANKHSNVKPYNCSLCPMAFTRLTGLYQHQESHENAQKPTRDHSCNICGKMFKSEKIAKACGKKHDKEGDFECTIDGCKEKFSLMNSYKQHQRRQHSGNVDKIPCLYCDSAFKTKADLKRHVFYKHEQRENVIPCSECPKMFISKERLKRHILTHAGTRFKCPYDGCNVTRNVEFAINFHFKEKHGIVKHWKSTSERLGTANATVSCNLCKMEVKKYKLRLHMKGHEKRRPMHCCFEECSQVIYSIERSRGPTTIFLFNTMNTCG